MARTGELLSANAEYAASFEKGHLPMPPSRRFAVVTCMDALLPVADGLDESSDGSVVVGGGVWTQAGGLQPPIRSLGGGTGAYSEGVSPDGVAPSSAGRVRRTASSTHSACATGSVRTPD